MNHSLVQAVAISVRTLRLDKKLSQEALAEMSGLDRTYISGVERGVRNITLDSLESIILALNIDYKTFFELVTKEINKNSK